MREGGLRRLVVPPGRLQVCEKLLPLWHITAIACEGFRGGETCCLIVPLSTAIPPLTPSWLLHLGPASHHLAIHAAQKAGTKSLLWVVGLSEALEEAEGRMLYTMAPSHLLGASMPINAMPECVCAAICLLLLCIAGTCGRFMLSHTRLHSLWGVSSPDL
jgi:hypothetical protein